MGRSAYLDHFRRTNLCEGPWMIKRARARASELLDDVKNEKFILLGSRVCAAFGVPYRPFESFGELLVLPHPSGLYRLWNVPGNYDRAREAVRAFAPRMANLLGIKTEGDS